MIAVAQLLFQDDTLQIAQGRRHRLIAFARPALADPRHRRLLARGDGASCVDECAITRVGRPARNGIRKSSLTLTANLRLGPASVSSQNAQRPEKSQSLMPRCQATVKLTTHPETGETVILCRSADRRSKERGHARQVQRADPT